MSDGFFKRGKVWWFRTDPLTGKQASSGKRDIASARLEYTERSRRATNPDYRPETTEDNSLNGWAVKFVEHKEATKSKATASFYAKKLGHLVRIFGADTPISNALRPAQFDAYALTRKAEGARPTTIRKEIGAARTLARFAARAGGYHGRPELFMPGDLSDDYEPGERFLTPSELVSLLAELPPHRAAHVALAVAIGCRFSETFRVTPEDVDTGAWLVTIRGTKTKRSRATVPVAEPFRELLRAALPYLPLRPWLNSNMKRDLAKACAKAGIAPVTSNDLRRTHGTWLAEAGVSDEHIGKVLRHADGRMARRVYGKLSPEKLGKLLEAKTASITTEGESDEGTGTRGLRGVRGVYGVEKLPGESHAAVGGPTREDSRGMESSDRSRDLNREAARMCPFWEDPPETGATIVQQLPARSESASTESPTIPDDSKEEDMRIENPRVGGSIPSRDTAKNQPSQEVGDFAKHQDVAPGNAKARNVRNENATAASGPSTRTQLTERETAQPAKQGGKSASQTSGYFSLIVDSDPVLDARRENDSPSIPKRHGLPGRPPGQPGLAHGGLAASRAPGENLSEEVAAGSTPVAGTTSVGWLGPLPPPSEPGSFDWLRDEWTGVR